MAEHENATRTREAYDAFGSGDLDRLNEYLPEDAVWHVTGSNVFSGDYKGRAEIYRYFGNLMTASNGTFKATLLHVVADDTYAVAIQKTTATMGGVDVATTDIVVDRMEDGQAVETWVYLENEKLLEGLQL